MVYYYTSKNMKILRSVIIEYGALNEISPQEYIKCYLESSQSMDEDKTCWVAETFVDIQRHGLFLQNISSQISKELSEENQDYFLLAFHAITFRILPHSMELLYKCLFNLSKHLLYIFATSLCEDDTLKLISQIAQSDYDISFITEKIINPLHSWQQYLTEMAQRFSDYVEEVNRQNTKQPTIPISPKVLNRKSKKLIRDEKFPVTPQNSVALNDKKMLTKDVIDKKLKKSYEDNKRKALHLLTNARNNHSHYAKCDAYSTDKKPTNIVCNTHKQVKSSTPILTEILDVKETSTSVKRINKRIELEEKEEIKWLQDLINDCRNTMKVETLQCNDREEREKERLLDIERKHLLGQISYEESIIAKKNLLNENKHKCAIFLKEKQQWEAEIQSWKTCEMEKNKKLVEKLSLSELYILYAKNNLLLKKKHDADEVKKESEQLLDKAIKEKQKDLEQKIKIIREIKMLEDISRKTKAPKVIDLTESSGVGLLAEMSIAELKERLNIVKVCLKEELEVKKKNIQEQNTNAKRDLEESKEYIKNYMCERSDLRKKTFRSNVNVDVTSNKEIQHLQNILNEKKKIRNNL